MSTESDELTIRSFDLTDSDKGQSETEEDAILVRLEGNASLASHREALDNYVKSGKGHKFWQEQMAKLLHTEAQVLQSGTKTREDKNMQNFVAQAKLAAHELRSGKYDPDLLERIEHNAGCLVSSSQPEHELISLAKVYTMAWTGSVAMADYEDAADREPTLAAIIH